MQQTVLPLITALPLRIEWSSTGLIAMDGSEKESTMVGCQGHERGGNDQVEMPEEFMQPASRKHSHSAVEVSIPRDNAFHQEFLRSISAWHWRMAVYVVGLTLALYLALGSGSKYEADSLDHSGLMEWGPRLRLGAQMIRVCIKTAAVKTWPSSHSTCCQVSAGLLIRGIGPPIRPSARPI